MPPRGSLGAVLDVAEIGTEPSLRDIYNQVRGLFSRLGNENTSDISDHSLEERRIRHPGFLGEAFIPKAVPLLGVADAREDGIQAINETTLVPGVSLAENVLVCVYVPHEAPDGHHVRGAEA